LTRNVTPASATTPTPASTIHALGFSLPTPIRGFIDTCERPAEALCAWRKTAFAATAARSTVHP
jgi:hypothetical protein